MNIRKFVLVLLCISAVGLAHGQSPKREMRAAWFTTVWGLDWPKTKITSTGNVTQINAQKNEFIQLIDALQSANINTIFFQVRSECDAMYRSAYEPWSAHLVATRGMDPGYDPFEFVIQEAHKRGIEVHAWLNPYRFESATGKYIGAVGDYRVSNPTWVLEYSSVAILDPGNPGVRQRIVDIVKDIMSKYDIDGLTFDDYFYAYGGTSSTLDQYAQNLYKPSDMTLGDWRRDNVNKMVADVYNAIQQTKPWITYGLSPFGIWTTNQTVAAKEGIELPQGITGGDMYAEIYCDPVAWLKAGTVDYVSPQLYWPTTSTGQDYDVLSPWWSNLSNRFRRHFYSSQSLSALDPSGYLAKEELKRAQLDTSVVDVKGLSHVEMYSFMGENQLKSTNGIALAPTEYGLQIQRNRTSDKNGAPGSVFFRAANFNTAGFVNYLKQFEFKHRSLPPAINWKPFENRTLPTGLTLVGNELQWSSTETNVRYVVYAVPNELANNSGNFSLPDYLLGIAYDKKFDLTKFQSLIGTHKFAVAVLDRYGNEFAPVLMDHTPIANQAAQLTYPSDNQLVPTPFVFQWNAVNGAEMYLLDVAADVNFSQIIYSRELAQNQFASTNIPMANGSTYYWRVRTRKIGVDDSVSATFAFTISQISITSPVNNATDVSLTPVVQWTNFGVDFKYTLQISTSATFTSILHQAVDLTENSYTVPQGVLFTYGVYYLRVRASNTQTTYDWSTVVKISTLQTPPSVPVIIDPLHNSNVAGTSIPIKWEENPLAKRFRVQLSTSPSFPVLSSKNIYVNAFTYQTVAENLTQGTWYVRMYAEYGTTYTSWSDVVTFHIVGTSVKDPNEGVYKLECRSPLSESSSRVLYSLPVSGKIKLYVSDLSGRVIVVMEDGFKSAGDYNSTLNSGSWSRGLYFIILEYPNGKKAIRVMK
jgi:uncharacterized lipoprotein YddW (UPF0748 family)